MSHHMSTGLPANATQKCFEEEQKDFTYAVNETSRRYARWKSTQPVPRLQTIFQNAIDNNWILLTKVVVVVSLSPS